ncbi:MAG: DUF4129 domain-containing protein [Acidobacteriota bacterium]|nr:DUF4129 domain-containing protein [Acidobacteriota bacterium]
MTARSASAQFALGAALLGSLIFVSPRAAHADDPLSPQTIPATQTADVSMADYRTHLTQLISVVQQCAKARDLVHCDAKLVGPDDRVPLTQNGQQTRRLVSYAWLRILLHGALVIDKPKPEPAKPGKTEPLKNKSDAAQESADAPPTNGELLEDAIDRLNDDLVQAGGTPVPVPAHTSAHAALKQVLAGSEFSHLNRRTMRDSLLEQLNKWLNDLLSHLVGSRSQSPWVGRLIFWGFILLVCLGLAWGLLQLERRWRIRLVPESLAPAPGAASARDWQLWLADARKSAANSDWREAIHFLYWAAISRLESRRLWPADRARTPREYLALVSADDPRKQGLSALTRSFEHTWYGGRPADEPAYRAAEELASALIGTGTKGGAV